MGEKTGAEVNLERVPLKYDGIAPWEIWLSESQERMVLAVPPEKLEKLKKLFADEDVDCSDIGTFTQDGRLKVKHGDRWCWWTWPCRSLHDGVPKRSMESRWTAPRPLLNAFPVFGQKGEAPPFTPPCAVRFVPTHGGLERMGGAPIRS
jgi:phosphoribosylformylglycinamidine (FGAM) synthase-like enzyme